MAKHKGSCLCKEVQFELDGDFESFFLCHCRYCQKDTGSAHAANLFSTKATLRWLSGEAKLSSYNLPSTRHSKSFCSSCGSAMPSTQEQGSLLVVPAGCLDTEISIAPNAHIFCASRASWDDRLESFPQFSHFPELPPEA